MWKDILEKGWVIAGLVLDRHHTTHKPGQRDSSRGCHSSWDRAASTAAGRLPRRSNTWEKGNLRCANARRVENEAHQLQPCSCKGVRRKVLGWSSALEKWAEKNSTNSTLSRLRSSHLSPELQRLLQELKGAMIILKIGDKVFYSKLTANGQKATRSTTQHTMASLRHMPLQIVHPRDLPKHRDSWRYKELRYQFCQFRTWLAIKTCQGKLIIQFNGTF